MEHKAEIVHLEPAGDGHLAVTARCCNDPSTDSVLTVIDIHRADEAIDKDIDEHLARVEMWHAARDHAQRHIARLLKK